MHKHVSVSWPALIVVSGLVVFSAFNIARAITETTLSQSIQLNRIRVFHTDIISAATTTDPDGTCNSLAKRVVLDTVPAGGQMNSIVSKGNVALTGPGISSISVRSIVAEQNGQQISSGNIGMPNGSIDDTAYIENRIPGSPEIAFYSASATWDIVAYFCATDSSAQPVSLNALTGGSADFFVSVTK